jgi:hypothetical protein
MTPQGDKTNQLINVEVCSLAEGHATLHLPRHLSPQTVAYLEQWLRLIRKKLRPVAGTRPEKEE